MLWITILIKAHPFSLPFSNCLKTIAHALPRFKPVTLPVPLPRARFEPPEAWKDQKQLLQFLKTPSGTKFLLTLHALVTRRDLTVQECSTHDYGVTAGMSRLLGEIESMAVDGESETDGKTGEE